MSHLLEAAERVKRYCAGLSLAQLEADEMRLLAVIKSIEIIGEASTKVSPLTTARLASVDWQGVRRMRNRLIHGYDSIDVARVWDAVEIDITPLISEITSALAHWPQS